MDLFRNKRIYTIFIAISMAAITWLLGYVAFLTRIESVYYEKSFSFLVMNTESVAVGAWDAQLSGGAGYSLVDGGKECVVLSVYLTQEDGKEVLSTFGNNDKDVSILTKRIKKLYFKTSEQKCNKERYVAALNSLYSGMEALEQAIIKLDRGSTQESCKRMLGQIVKVLRYCAKSYQDIFPAYANMCNLASEKLQSYIEQTVYVKDLRYELCDLAVNYLKLASIFAL